MTYISGKTIKGLREKKKLTQKDLADRLMVSDKTVSKWETDRGLPDISILSELASALSVSVPELLTGDVAENKNRSANMKRSKFYVCPICGNVIYSVGAGAFSCCGIRLPELEPEEADENHRIQISHIENEIYVQIEHPMQKTHYISFIACVSDDSIQIKKLYPEQMADAYFRRGRSVRLYAYCNRHGLFEIK
jgi:desulfoferrodoxin